MPPLYLEIYLPVPLKQSFSYQVPEEWQDKAQLGVRAEVFFGKRKLTGWVVKTKSEKPQGFELKNIIRIIDNEPLFGEELLELARWAAERYYCSTGEVLSAMLPGGKREKKPLHWDWKEEERITGNQIILSGEQKAAISTVLDGENPFSYLYGITGSGKTEVYLQVAESVLKKGRAVIYLVPEIALTHQLTDLIKQRFGNSVALIHSGLTPSMRLAEWRRLQKGEARLVIGARSAVFAPLNDLGLIIIDEEHENSYKSGSTPRYHARQVAMRRCRDSGARLIMGSATPSLEAWKLMEENVLTRLTLTQRLAGGKPPESIIVDMKKEKGEILSEKLRSEIRISADLGKQSILFLNRRGFSYYFHCLSCGYEKKCTRCSVSLTYHKEKNALVCHYCGYRERPAQVCPECGSLDTGYSGFGTEQVEEEIKKFFPDLTMARLDSDTAQKKGESARILKAFRKGEIDILLGTQMIAKGLNFPGVRLVGIVLADSGLNMPDFRASERTFALVSQVSGRAGRFSEDGLVIIQSYQPENPALVLASTEQYAEFYRRELEMRQLQKFPPYYRLLRVVFRGKNAKKTEALGEELAAVLKQAGIDGEVLGPAECPLAVISGNFRYQLIVRTRHFMKAHALLGQFLEAGKIPSGVYLECDVDPVSLL